MGVQYVRLTFASRDHERVSREWHRLLADLHRDGVPFNVNEGHRTMARQAQLVREKGVWSPRNPTGAAWPSPTAPHIRTGRVDHAVDLDGAALVVAAAGKRGVRLMRPIATEPWHVVPVPGDLERYYRKRKRQIARKRKLRRAKARAAAAAARRAKARAAKARARVAPKHRRVSRAGLELIASFEGFRADAYRDAVGVWTIGYGHTGGVRAGQRVTREGALDLLRRDAAAAEYAVRQAIRVGLNQAEYDALVCFAFNVGGGALASSTLAAKLNARKRRAAADEFLRWDRAGGQQLLGLTRRRQAERKLFLS